MARYRRSIRQCRSKTCEVVRRRSRTAPASRVSQRLSMLVSFRTGQDAAFIRVQNCLYDFWTEQEQVFGRRVLDGSRQVKRSDVEKFMLGRKFANAEDELNYIKDQLFRISKARPFVESRLKGAIEANQLVSMLATKRVRHLQRKSTRRSYIFSSSIEISPSSASRQKKKSL
jgi:hypothetical protein